MNNLNPKKHYRGFVSETNLRLIKLIYLLSKLNICQLLYRYMFISLIYIFKQVPLEARQLSLIKSTVRTLLPCDHHTAQNSLVFSKHPAITSQVFSDLTKGGKRGRNFLSSYQLPLR